MNGKTNPKTQGGASMTQQQKGEDEAMACEQTKRVTGCPPAKRAKIAAASTDVEVEAKQLGPPLMLTRGADILGVAGGLATSGDEMVSALRSEDQEEVALVSDSEKETDEDDQKRLGAFLWGDRYFEVQELGQMKCGKHAVNNLLGGPQYTDEDLESACDLVMSDVNMTDDRSAHAQENGWYSHSVLAKLFDMTNPCRWMLMFTPVKPDSYDAFMTNDAFEGILINKNNVDWVCIAKQSGHCFYVDSCDFPRKITPANFSHIITMFPMSFHVALNSAQVAMREEDLERMRSS